MELPDPLTCTLTPVVLNPVFILYFSEPSRGYILQPFFKKILTIFDPYVRKIPWKMEWQPTSIVLPGKFHGQTIWQATVAESDTTELLIQPY